MPEDTNAIPIRLAVLETARETAKVDQARVEESLKKLQSSVDTLQEVKARVQGILGVLSLVGLLGVGFFVFLWSQVSSLNNQIGKAQGEVGEVKGQISDYKGQLEKTFGEEKSKVDEYAKQRVSKLTDEITVPLGTMIPYFGATLPEGDRWIWADGKSPWPNEDWVPKNLQGKPVPDLTKGLLVGGSTPDVSVGNVWKGFGIDIAAVTLCVRLTVEYSS